jgi:hypothetical protein
MNGILTLIGGQNLYLLNASQVSSLLFYVLSLEIIREIFMNNGYERIWKQAGMTYFKVILS